VSVDCPVCKGKGKLERPNNDPYSRNQIKLMTKTLIDAGFSYRQVMKFFGWKSTRSVSQALK